MSVRVNLLPEATRQRGRASRQRGLLVGVGVLVLLAVGGTWWWSERQVQAAEERLADAQAETAGLRAEEAELVAFRDLEGALEELRDQLEVGLSDEISMAGLLQDLAMVFPAEAQLDTFGVAVRTDEQEGPGAVGAISLTGRTALSHAPGVESVLISLGRIATLDAPYLSSSVLDDADGREVVSFAVEAVVTDAARTRRYVEGLPEVDR